MKRIIFLNEDALTRRLEQIDKEISRLNPEDPQYEKKKAALETKKAKIDNTGSGVMRQQTGAAVSTELRNNGGQHTSGTVSAINMARQAKAENIQNNRNYSKEKQFTGKASHLDRVENAASQMQARNVQNAQNVRGMVNDPNNKAPATLNQTNKIKNLQDANAEASLQNKRDMLDRHLVQNGPNNGNVRYDPKTSSLVPRENWVK